MTGSYQGFSTSYTGLPESTSTFTLDLLGGSQQLTEKSPIFGKCCSHFALNIYHIYFNWIFHTHGDRFSKKIAVGAPIRIFLAFRICINFYSTLKIEPASPRGSWVPFGADFCVFGHFFVGKNLTLFWNLQISTPKCRRSSFYHLGGHEDHWPSYPKPPQLLL